MFMKKSLWAIAIILSIISCHGMTVTCGRLEKVSAGEFHSLALADDGTLWSCGGRSDIHYQLGLGSGVYNVNTLQQVKGENGNGYLQYIVAFDAGWYHSLAADSNGVCYSFGHDTSGQLGNGPTKLDWDVPYRINGYGDLNEDTNVVYVSAGINRGRWGC
jgi:alpha-tubulin suppressor-like RCC1 family protein